MSDKKAANRLSEQGLERVMRDILKGVRALSAGMDAADDVVTAAATKNIRGGEPRAFPRFTSLDSTDLP